MPKIISMINWKGGVGKSTLSLHIGVGLMRLTDGHPKVLLIDLDPQCNLSYLALGVSQYSQLVYNKQSPQPTLKNIFDSYFKGEEFDTNQAIIKQPITSSPGYIWSNVDILPSHQELVLVDMRLARERKSGTSHQEETKYELDKLSIIHKAIEQVANDYEYVILDCPPNINLVTQNAFFASQSYFIPAIPDFLSTIGISLIKAEMEKLNKDFSSMIKYAGIDINYCDTQLKGIIFNLVDEYGGVPKKTHKGTINSVSSQHPGMVFDEYVTDGDGISTAAENNLTVFSHTALPKSNANAEKQATLIEGVVKQFINRL